MIETTLLAEVVRTLVGPTAPVGEANTDEKRLENLHLLIELTEGLLADISRVASYRDRREYSMQRAGKTAHAFLRVAKEYCHD